MARKFRKNSTHGELDFELNLASIIDCFTVLITYLLVSASFLSLGILDVTVAVPAQAQEVTPPPERPKLTVTIALGMNHDLELRTEGAETKNYPLASKAGGWDFTALTGYLTSFKVKYPLLDSALITADDRVEYKEVVKTIEATRATLPNVALGTEQIGLWAP